MEGGREGEGGRGSWREGGREGGGKEGGREGCRERGERAKTVRHCFIIL